MKQKENTALTGIYAEGPVLVLRDLCREENSSWWAGM